MLRIRGRGILLSGTFARARVRKLPQQVPMVMPLICLLSFGSQS